MHESKEEVKIKDKARWAETKNTVSRYPNVPVFLITSFLSGGNWLIYIWAVNSKPDCRGKPWILYQSTGERLYRNGVFARASPPSSIALAGACIYRVFFLTLRYDRVPWIVIALAVTFGTYGLLRKTAKAGSTVGLLFNTTFLTPIVLIYLIISAADGSRRFRFD